VRWALASAEAFCGRLAAWAEFGGLIIATAIAATAWIYQRAWDRQQVRIERYQAILDRLPGFTQAELNRTISTPQ
jgi:hypothetical protein